MLESAAQSAGADRTRDVHGRDRTWITGRGSSAPGLPLVQCRWIIGAEATVTACVQGLDPPPPSPGGGVVCRVDSTGHDLNPPLTAGPG